MERRFNIGDVVYVVSNAKTIPIVITEIKMENGSYLYGFSWIEYLKTAKAALSAGFKKEVIPLFKKGQMFVQEDLYESQEAILSIASDLIEIINIIKTEENNIQK